MIKCIKCKEEHDGDHNCIEEMTIEELFDQSLIEVRALWSKAKVPPGQDPDDDDFKP